MIAVGDFLQLRPCSNYLYGDPGDAAHQSSAFSALHPVILTQIMRTKDTELIKVNSYETSNRMCPRS